MSNILYSEAKPEIDEIPKEIPSQEVVEKLWKMFLNEFKDKIDSFFMSYAVTTIPIWKSPETVYFKLSSNIAQGTLSNNKSIFIPYFKNRLHVENLKFESEVEIIENETFTTTTGYSLEERLNDLQNENPSVTSFLEKFGLKITGNE